MSSCDRWRPARPSRMPPCYGSWLDRNASAGALTDSVQSGADGDRIARRVPRARAGGRWSSAASCAIGCSDGVEGPRHRGLRHRRQDQLPAVLAELGPRRAGRPGVPGLQAGRRRRRAAAPRVEERPRAQGLHRRRRSVHADRGRGTAARLHHQRHRVGSADRRVPRPVGRTRGSRAAACCGSSIRSGLRRLAARPARAAVRGPLRADARAGQRSHLPRDSRSTTCRPSGSGASSRSCCWWRSARRSASPWRASWA